MACIAFQAGWGKVILEIVSSETIGNLQTTDVIIVVYNGLGEDSDSGGRIGEGVIATEIVGEGSEGR